MATPRSRRVPVGPSSLSAVLLVCVSICLFAAPAQALPGRLDNTFSDDGKAITDFSGASGGRAVALQSDGRIVLAGWTSPLGLTRDFGLARFNKDGTLDATFGVGGQVTTDFGASAVARAVAVQPDHRIVAGGCTAAGNDFALARYNLDGSLDTTFGVGGLVTTDFGGGETIRGLVLQPDGKIVVAGMTQSSGAALTCAEPGAGSRADDADDINSSPAAVTAGFALARYNVDGSLDSTFGVGGKVVSSFDGGGEARGVALQADGKIVAAGGAGSNFIVARYTTDGSLDGSFGTGGSVSTDIGNDDEARGVVIQADGKIVEGGLTKSQTLGFQYFALVRLNADGSLDGSFGTGGVVVSPQIVGPSVARAIGLEPNGQIVLVGYAGYPGSDFLVARYNSDGSLDARFGPGGWVTTSFGGADGARAVTIQPDGRIVAAGYAGMGHFLFAVARYLFK